MTRVRAYRLYRWRRCDAVLDQVKSIDFSGEGEKRVVAAKVKGWVVVDFEIARNDPSSTQWWSIPIPSSSNYQ